MCCRYIIACMVVGAAFYTYAISVVLGVLANMSHHNAEVDRRDLLKSVNAFMAYLKV